MFLRWPLLLLSLFFCNTAISADAQKHHDMSAMWKNSLARQQLSTSAVFDEHGVLWLARVQDGHVLVSHSIDQGKIFTQAVKVNAQPEAVSASGETRPKIVVDKKGNIYLSWTQSLETPFAGNIRFSRSLDGGKTFSAPITVNDNPDPITHRFEAMGINAKGQIYLSWLDKRDAVIAKSKGEVYGGIAIYSALSDDEGQHFHKNVKIADHTCECCRIAMAIDNTDTPVIVWRHIFGKNVRDHGMARLTQAVMEGKQHSTDESAVQRVTFENWAVEACPHHGPSISISGNILHMVWFNHGTERSGLFYAHARDGEKTFSEPLNLGIASRQPGHASVLSLNKNIYLAWKEFDGETSTIKMMHSADAGENWGAVQEIAGTRDQSDHPLLIANQDQVYLSWSTQNEGYRLISFQDDKQ